MRKAALTFILLACAACQPAMTPKQAWLGAKLSGAALARPAANYAEECAAFPSRDCIDITRRLQEKGKEVRQVAEDGDTMLKSFACDQTEEDVGCRRDRDNWLRLSAAMLNRMVLQMQADLANGENNG